MNKINFIVLDGVYALLTGVVRAKTEWHLFWECPTSLVRAINFSVILYNL